MTSETSLPERRWTLKLEEDLELQLEEDSLEKITTVNTFVTEFAFAVENTWVTTLLISYATESHLDSFMWTIPIVVSVLIRPYIESYVSKFRLSLSCYMRHIILFYLGAALGHAIVVLSTYPTYLIDHRRVEFIPYHFLRIITSIVGWTMVDVCLDFVISNSDGIAELNTKIEGTDERKQNTDMLALVSRVCAYGLSAFACAGPFTFRNFQIHTCLMYSLAGIMCLVGAIHTFFQNRIQVLSSDQSYKKADSLLNSLKYFKQSIFGTKIRVDTYLPGFYETLAAPLQLKMHLAILFAYNYIADTVYIYTCIWIAVSYIKSEDITAQMYIVGIKYGALLMGGLSVLLYAVKVALAGVRKNTSMLLSAYIAIMVVSIIISMYAGITMDIMALGSFVVITGAIVGVSQIYFEQNDDKLNAQFPEYVLCSGFVGTMQKLFILCPMPFYWMILMSDDDIPNCIWWAVIAMYTILLLVVHQKFATAEMRSSIESRQSQELKAGEKAKDE